jgi:hypothetical protein
MSVQSTACVALGLLLASVLASCAGPGPGVTGNDTGGIIPYASVSRELARDMAIDHCGGYGKEARATGVDAQYGGYYSFACRFNAKRPY